LVAVERIITGIHIEDNAGRRSDVLLQEGIDQEGLHGGQMRDDLFVSAVGIGPDGSQFKTIESTLASQGLTSITVVRPTASTRIFFVGQHGQKRIMPELVMVIDILVAEAEAKDALLQEFRKFVLDSGWVTVIREAPGELLDKVKFLLDLAEQKTTGIRSDKSTIKSGHYLTRMEVLEKQFFLITICHSGRPFLGFS
jgi:hypothetical protein